MTAEVHEEWRDVSGTDGALRVSSFGRVFRTRRSGTTGRKGKIGEAFTPLPPKNSVWVPNRGRIDVSCLVLEEFVGSCPDGMECCHWDDDRSNNRLDNLRWDTHSNNVKDGYRNGAVRKRINSEDAGQAKLTNDDVAFVRSMYLSLPDVWTYGKLAELFKVTKITIRRIVKRKTWRDVP